LRDPDDPTMADDDTPALVAPRLPQCPSLQIQVNLALVKIGNGLSSALLRKDILTRFQTQHTHRTPPFTSIHLPAGYAATPSMLVYATRCRPVQRHKLLIVTITDCSLENCTSPAQGNCTLVHTPLVAIIGP
jgi:hypothetical protein